MATELPIGFAMALAMNELAMKKFESLSPAEKESIVQQTHSVKSRNEMQKQISGPLSQFCRPNAAVNANLKMTVFAEKGCHFSPDSIQVYLNP